MYIYIYIERERQRERERKLFVEAFVAQWEEKAAWVRERESSGER